MTSRCNPRFGELLRWQRDLRNWTQQEVAERLRALCRTDGHHPGVTAQMVSTWERSVKLPERFYRSKLCILYDASAEQLGFAIPPDQAYAGTGRVERPAPAPDPLPPPGTPEDDGGMPLDRRTFIAGTGATFMMIPLEVFGRGEGVDWERYEVETLDSLEVCLQHYHQMYKHVPPLTLLPPVLGHLQMTHELLKAGPPAAEQRRLLHNRSVAALLAARMSFFDLRQHAAARAYYSMSAEAAAEGGDALLTAVVLAHMSYLPAVSGDLEGARSLLDRARTQVGQPEPFLESWLRAAESEFAADAGRERVALQALELAHLADQDDGAPPPWWFDFYDHDRLIGITGHAYVQLGRRGDARTTLQRALTALDPAAVKQRTVYLADLATCHVHEREIEEACRAAGLALDCLEHSGYGSVGPRLQRLRTLLEPYRSVPAVAHLGDRIEAMAHP